MKKTFFLLGFAIVMSFTIASAQTDTISKESDKSNTIRDQKKEFVTTSKDSVKKSTAVNQAEKKSLNGDYNNATKDYNKNYALAKKELPATQDLKDKKALKKYNTDKKEYRKDLAASKRQHRKFNAATADKNVSPAERAAMEKKYKSDKKHYINDKKTLNNQKQQVKKDSTNQQ